MGEQRQEQGDKKKNPEQQGLLLSQGNTEPQFSKKLLLSFAIGMVVGGGAMWLWYVVAEPRNNSEVARGNEEISEILPSNRTGENDDTALNAPVNATTHEGNSIAVSDQPAGRTVAVSRVALSAPSWVVIHEVNPDGTPANALGARWFPKGESSAVFELLRGTQAGNTYFAILYSDNGNRIFEFQGADAPIRDAQGEPIRVVFTTN